MLRWVAVAAVVVTLTPACRFPDLPVLDEDATNGPDASADGPSGPNVRITAGPAANSTTGPRVRFEFEVLDGTPSCRFDNQPLIACTSPVVTNLTAGIHTFLVQATSSSGSVDSDSRLWNVECAAAQGDTSTFGLFHMDEGTGVVLTNARPFQLPPPSRDGQLGDGNPMHEPDRVAPGRFGNGALRFTGYAPYETDRIFANSLLDPPASESIGEHSIEMWVNPTPSFAHDLALFSVYSAVPAGHLSYWLKFVRTGTTGYFRLETRDGGIDRNVNSQMVDVGIYHYVVVSFVPGTQPLLFVDGVATRIAEPVSGTFDFFFDGFSPYEGDLDELHLSFRGVTENELLDRWCPP